MTEEYLNKMKADLISRYEDELCEESVADINAAATLGEFIAIVSKYATFLRYQTIPSLPWIRQWLGEYADECAQHYCYIDKYVSVNDPKQDVIAYGDSRLALIFTQPKTYNVYLHDAARATLVAVGTSFVKVRTKGTSTADIISKSTTSKIKIRKV